MGPKKNLSPTSAALQEIFGSYSGGELDSDDRLDNQAEFEDELGPDDELDNPAGLDDILDPNNELENQLPLPGDQGEDDNLFTTNSGGNSLLSGTLSPLLRPGNPQEQNLVSPPNSKTHEQLPAPNAAILDPEIEDKISSDPNDGNDAGNPKNQPVERDTHGRSYPGEPHSDSESHEPADPGPRSPYTTTRFSHPSGEHHGQEHATDHGRDMRSGQSNQSNSERQARTPGRRSSSPNQVKSWKYERIRYGVTETLFEYTYDESGRLSAEGGYENTIIQNYLANHALYIGRDIKDCGLTLWIQRAPRTADYRGGAAGRLCLYKKCAVSKDRSIKPGDVRVAFDDSYARTPEHDPQANAAYVHLECLEMRIPEDLREMYARLNFKVEERGPHPDDPLLRNPTIFSTMQEILYAENYLKQCRQEFKEEGNHRPIHKTFYSGSLSAGIEKQRKSQYEVVRGFQRKILELGGSQAWYKMNTILEQQYVQAGGPAATADTRIDPQTTGTRPDPTRRQPRGAESNQSDFDVEGPLPGTNQEHDTNDSPIPEDPYAPRLSDSPVRVVSQQQPATRKPPPTKPKKFKKKGKDKEIEPPYIGRGKTKQRMFIDDDGNQVWEEFEDPFSNPESDHEPNRRTRKPRNVQREGSDAGARDDGQKKKEKEGPQVNLDDGDGDGDEDGGDEGDRRVTKRTRGDESQGQKRKRGRPRKR